MLRGARARFQLFGDTVNTTARVEQTGLPGKIQVSKQCAELIAEGGKGHWLAKRSDDILVKGKGVLQTYWVNVKRNVRGNKFSESGNSSFDYSLDDIQISDSRQERLITWNMEQLAAILQQVVTRRMAEKSNMKPWSWHSQTCDITNKGRSILEAVQEIIVLPAYNAKVGSRQTKMEMTKVIPQIALDQLRQYVTEVSMLYQANEFHNFEHASSGKWELTKEQETCLSTFHSGNVCVETAVAHCCSNGL